jgi:hypothetical protein
VAEIDPQSSADELETGGATLAMLQHDPAWGWLHDPDEDVYTEADVRGAPDA